MSASCDRFKLQLVLGRRHPTVRLPQSSTRLHQRSRRSSAARSQTRIRTKILRLPSIFMWMTDPPRSHAHREIRVRSPFSPASRMNLWSACHPKHLRIMHLRNLSSARLLVRAALASSAPGKTALGCSPRRASRLKVTLKRTQPARPNWERVSTAPSPVRPPQIVRRGVA